MSLSILTRTALYVSFILLLLYLKRRYPNNSIIVFFKRYGGVLLIGCFIYIFSAIWIAIYRNQGSNNAWNFRTRGRHF